MFANPRTPAKLDDSRWRVTAGSDARGWKDITSIIDGLQYNSIRPGGPSSAQMNMRGVDFARVGFNEVHVDSALRIEYENKLAWDGILRPQKYQYATEGAGSNDDVIPLSAAGLVDQAKRRSDYTGFWAQMNYLDGWNLVVQGDWTTFTTTDISVYGHVGGAGGVLRESANQYWLPDTTTAALAYLTLQFEISDPGAQSSFEILTKPFGTTTFNLLWASTPGVYYPPATRNFVLPANTQAVSIYFYVLAACTGADIAVYIPCVFATGYTSPPSVAQMLTDIVVCPGLASSVSVPYPPTSFSGTNMWSIITPTSRGQAVEDLLTKSNEQLSWEFRNGVLQVERVGGAVDPARVFPITHDTPGVTVDLDLVSDTKPDAFLLTYTCAGVATTSYYPFNPPSPTAMVETLAIGGDNVSTAEAQTQANQEWMRRSSHVADGAIGVTGGLRSNAGTWTPAPLLRAGDYVDVTDMVGHAPMMITGVAYDTASNQATLTVGGLETRRIIVPGAPIATRTYSAPVAAAPTAQIMGGVAHP